MMLATALRTAGVLRAAVVVTACSSGSTHAGSSKPATAASPAVSPSVNVSSILSSVLSAAPTAQPLPTTRALADPCSVLTPAEIRAELGWMPAQGRAAGEGLCFYTQPYTGVPTAPPAGVQILIEPGGKDRFESKRMVTDDAEDLTGIGDGAYFVAADSHVTFVKAQDVVLLSIGDPQLAAATLKAHLIALARDAAATL
jgi:hypothetical protein